MLLVRFWLLSREAKMLFTCRLIIAMISCMDDEAHSLIISIEKTINEISVYTCM